MRPRPDGTTSFADLQSAIDRKRTDDLVYFAFDLLFLDRGCTLGRYCSGTTTTRESFATPAAV
jgi:hypothetical protein